MKKKIESFDLDGLLKAREELSKVRGYIDKDIIEYAKLVEDPSSYGRLINDDYNGDREMADHWCDREKELLAEIFSKEGIIIEVTLQKPASDFCDWERGQSAVVVDELCPKCGSLVVCAHSDMGSSDFCDVYNHVCSNPDCDFIQAKDIPGLVMGSRDMYGPDNCPFCGRIV